jgi:hypothetical protein
VGDLCPTGTNKEHHFLPFSIARKILAYHYIIHGNMSELQGRIKALNEYLEFDLTDNEFFLSLLLICLPYGKFLMGVDNPNCQAQCGFSLSSYVKQWGNWGRHYSNDDYEEENEDVLKYYKFPLHTIESWDELGDESENESVGRERPSITESWLKEN